MIESSRCRLRVSCCFVLFWNDSMKMNEGMNQSINRFLWFLQKIASKVQVPLAWSREITYLFGRSRWHNCFVLTHERILWFLRACVRAYASWLGIRRHCIARHCTANSKTHRREDHHPSHTETKPENAEKSTNNGRSKCFVGTVRTDEQNFSKNVGLRLIHRFKHVPIT